MLLQLAIDVESEDFFFGVRQKYTCFPPDDLSKRLSKKLFKKTGLA
jgi:hypothetical protein